MADEKHIGVQVSEELHYKLKLMAAQKRTKITDMVVPLIKKLVEGWEAEESARNKKGGDK